MQQSCQSGFSPPFELISRAIGFPIAASAHGGVLTAAGGCSCICAEAAQGLWKRRVIPAHPEDIMVSQKQDLPDTPAEPEMVTIIRYPNRRLYDRSLGRYVTLKDVEDTIRQGRTVSVRDSKTGEDL